MKYLKTFEDNNKNFEIGEHVYFTLPGYEHSGDIIKIDDDYYFRIKISKLNREVVAKKEQIRHMTEEEKIKYDASKYNL